MIVLSFFCGLGKRCKCKQIIVHNNNIIIVIILAAIIIIIMYSNMYRLYYHSSNEVSRLERALAYSMEEKHLGSNVKLYYLWPRCQFKKLPFGFL